MALISSIEDTGGRSDGCITRILAILIFLTTWLLYTVTAAPEVTFHDSGELITAAASLGIPHPPGSPTWCIIARLFTLIPVGSLAFRVHLMSAFFAALTCVLTYLTVRRILSRDHIRSRFLTHTSGISAALILATNLAFWEKAVQAELYTLNAFFMIALFALFDAWYHADKTARRSRLLLAAMGAIFGLGTGNYMAILYFVPVFGIAILIRYWRVILDWKAILMAGLAFALGLAVYLYLPIRSAANPAIDWGNPETLDAFLSVMRRERWGSFTFNNVSGRFILRWLQSYDLPNQLGWPALLLAIVGILSLGRRNPLLTALMLASFYVYGTVMMLMQATTPVLARNLLYVTYYGMQEFHIPLYLVIAILTGLGLSACAEALRNTPLMARPRLTELITVIATVCIVGIQLLITFPRANYRDFRHAYAYGQAVLDSLPQNAWIIPGNDNNFFILTYMKFCAEYRPDISIITPNRRFDQWYLAHASTNTPPTPTETVKAFEQRSDEFIDPILNQRIDFDGATEVHFAVCPSHEPWPQLVYPRGFTFVLGPAPANVEEQQRAFWETDLSGPYFSVGASDKPDYRDHMINMLMSHAWWHASRQQFKLAHSLYTYAMEYTLQPRAGLYAGLAVCELRLGDVGAAATSAIAALDMDPDDIEALNVLGIACAVQGRYDQATDCFMRILTLDPAHTQAKQNLERVARDRNAATR